MIYNDNIEAIVEKATIEIKGATSVAWLQIVESNYIGPNGIIPRSIKSATTLPKKAQQERVTALETAKTTLSNLIAKKMKEFRMVK